MKLSKTQSFVFAVVMTASSAAMAQDPPPDPTQPPPSAPPMTTSTGGVGMGGPGQIVIAADIPFVTTSPVGQLAWSQESFMGMSTSATAITLAPSGDYFIAPNISVGALLGVDYVSSEGASQTTFGLMPRAGYSLSLTDVISVWARLGLGYFYSSASAGGMSASGYVIPVLVEAPVLWHPATHFFIGAGPRFSYTLVSKIEGNDAPKTTELGVMTMIGGYFGG